MYGPDGISLDPFTSADNADHGQLWTPLIPGDEVTIEVVLPESQRQELELELGRINHGYRPLRQPPSKQSGSCNIDTVCPQAAPWRNQVRSVARYTIQGTALCTGVLVNNTAEDFTPFFLTADHCGQAGGPFSSYFDEEDAASVVAYWNFENSFCRPPGTAEAGGEGDEDLDRLDTNSGASLEMRYSGDDTQIEGGPDTALLKLDNDVDPDIDAYYAGWDRTDTAPEEGIAIHHPRGEEKRISFTDRPTQKTGYLDMPPSAEETHLYVEAWDEGTTERGSSGSPLLDEAGRVTGVLSGGLAACDGTEPNNEPDWYGRLAQAWDGGGTPDSRLRDHLDPTGTNPESLDGVNQITGVDPPAAITDFRVQSLDATDDVLSFTLAWTATGSDGTVGSATTYDMRFDTSPIESLSDFSEANRLFGLPAPQEAGTEETFTVENLETGETYYFGLLAFNDRGDSTPLATASTDIPPPDPISDFRASAEADGVKLSWTATGDSEDKGAASAYDLWFSNSPIRSLDDTLEANRVSGLPEPDTAGTQETFKIRDLEPQQPFYFAIRAINSAGIPSSLAYTTDNVILLQENVKFAAPYPNPTRAQATIELAVEEEQEQPVEIRLYDARGRHVETVYRDTPTPNRQTEVMIDLDHLSSGRYFFQLRGDAVSKTQPITVVR